MLISHGADVNNSDVDGMVPLHMILYCRDSMHVPTDLSPDILRVLIFPETAISNNTVPVFSSFN